MTPEDSPFDRPKISMGYPLDRDEAEAIASHLAKTTDRSIMTYTITITRRAVATLDEVEAYLDSRLGYEVPAFPEYGGQIGPLPDGTMIEVERVR